MGRANKITLAGFTALLAIVMVVAFWPAPEPQIIMGNASLALTSAEIAELMPQATRGDAEAAFRLAQHYSMVEINETAAMHWWEVAAMQGHVVAQHNLAYELIERAGPGDVEQGWRWLELAARNGDRSAAERLEREAAKARH